jgi:hypothetical protein
MQPGELWGNNVNAVILVQKLKSLGEIGGLKSNERLMKGL